MTDELDGPTARDFGMTDDTIPEPISAEGLTRMRRESEDARNGDGADYTDVDALLGLIDAQAARIAELEAERDDLGWLPRDRREVDQMLRESAAMRATLDRALVTPGAFIVAD